MWKFFTMEIISFKIKIIEDTLQPDKLQIVSQMVEILLLKR